MTDLRYDIIEKNIRHLKKNKNFVMEIQEMLNEVTGINYHNIKVDGIYGNETRKAIKKFKFLHYNLLNDDKLTGDVIWNLFAGMAYKPNKYDIMDLTKPHKYFEDSTLWKFGEHGIELNGFMPDFKVDKDEKILEAENMLVIHYEDVFKASSYFRVPAELIYATFMTESYGNPKAIREEPGYISDEKTPHRVSPGIMQTLISTARVALKDNSINTKYLLVPANSINAGTAYISRQWYITKYDPVLVAAAYNAGRLAYQNGENNRFKLRQYPIGTDHHCIRFIKWFNLFFKLIKTNNDIKFDCAFSNLI